MIYSKKKAVCIIGLYSLFLLTGCGQNGQRAALETSTQAEQTPNGGNDGEIQIYSDQQVSRPTVQEESAHVQSGPVIIEDQSFDTRLEGWGDVRFVSCEPTDSLDTPHFYLMRDNRILYTFPWEDRTATPGLFDSVRFVSFPDLDGDGRKDVIIGVGKIFDTADSHIPYSVISIFLNKENGFEPAVQAEDQVNEAVMYGEAEYKEVGPLAQKFIDGIESPLQQAAGSWTLDGDKTEKNGLKQYGSLTEMFGTGLQMGDSLEISESGAINYYIGIGIGGTGQCEIEGDTITADITPYEDLGDAQKILELNMVTEDGKPYLVMEYDGETLYWSK